jgi:hypothetical protein
MSKRDVALIAAASITAAVVVALIAHGDEPWPPEEQTVTKATVATFKVQPCIATSAMLSSTRR